MVDYLKEKLLWGGFADVQFQDGVTLAFVKKLFMS